MSSLLHALDAYLWPRKGKWYAEGSMLWPGIVPLRLGYGEAILGSYLVWVCAAPCGWRSGHVEPLFTLALCSSPRPWERPRWALTLRLAFSFHSPQPSQMRSVHWQCQHGIGKSKRGADTHAARSFSCGRDVCWAYFTAPPALYARLRTRRMLCAVPPLPQPSSYTLPFFNSWN